MSQTVRQRPDVPCHVAPFDDAESVLCRMAEARIFADTAYVLASILPASRRDHGCEAMALANWRRRRDGECAVSRMLDGSPRRPRAERLEHPIVWTVDSTEARNAS